MPRQDVTPNASGSITLGAPALVDVTAGTVLFSTDSGATYRPFGLGGISREYIFPAGSLLWKGNAMTPATFNYMPG